MEVFDKMIAGLAVIWLYGVVAFITYYVWVMAIKSLAGLFRHKRKCRHWKVGEL